MVAARRRRTPRADGGGYRAPLAMPSAASGISRTARR